MLQENVSGSTSPDISGNSRIQILVSQMMNTLLTSDEALETIHRHYSLGNVDYCMFIRRGFNDTYLVDTGSERYIFRLYLNGKYYVESDDAYRFELDLIKHLHTRDVPVATGIPTVNGEYIGVMQTVHGQRAFALFCYADGIPLSRNSVTNEQGYQLGVALANLHLAANSFESQFERYKLDLKYMVDEPFRLISDGEKCAEPNDKIRRGRRVIEMLQPIEPYIDRIRSIGTDSDKFGIIHADFHLGNVHFRGNELTVFDFDHCAYGWRAYDLAISSSLPEAQQASMIKGYESKRPLSQEERDSLMDLGNLRNLWDIGDVLATENLRAE